MEGRKHSRLLPPRIKTKTSPNASFDWLIFRILLNCYGFDKMEEISRWCLSVPTAKIMSSSLDSVSTSPATSGRGNWIKMRNHWVFSPSGLVTPTTTASSSDEQPDQSPIRSGGRRSLARSCWGMFLCFSFLRRPVWMTMTGRAQLSACSSLLTNFNPSYSCTLYDPLVLTEYLMLVNAPGC